MDRFSKFCFGIQFFHQHGLRGFEIDAEHDVLYVGDARKIKLKLSEIRVLYKWGWRIDKDVERWYFFT